MRVSSVKAGTWAVTVTLKVTRLLGKLAITSVSACCFGGMAGERQRCARTPHSLLSCVRGCRCGRDGEGAHWEGSVKGE